MYTAIHPNLTLAEAAERWIYARSRSVGRSRYVSERYIVDLQQYARALSRKFGRVRLKNITLRRLREYQLERGETCGPNRINQELGALIQIMKWGGAWGKGLDACYEPLRHEYSEVRRAMNPEEQRKFLRTASSREAWSFVYHFSLLALATTASHAEMRALRIGDVDLSRKLLRISREHAKNRYRIRTIPMHEQAIWAATQLLNRAARLGATRPDDYLFPFRCARQEWDPERPMSDSGLKRMWHEVRTAAGLPWLRVHDLRHTAITRMAEAGVPIPVIMGIAGHMSVQMHTHYTAVSMVAKWHAVQMTKLENCVPEEILERKKRMAGSREIRILAA